MRKSAKFFINVLTTLGAGVAVVSIPYAFNGHLRTAWALMGIALLVDWIDGSLVRYFRLDPCLSGYDGARLDEYADLMTYAIAPVLAALASGVLPKWLTGYAIVVFVCAVSCLQFSRVTSKSDRAFRGWPCYWNFVYFYCWGLEMSPAWTILLSVILGLATFTPVPFPYPSKFLLQQQILIPMGVLWFGLVTLSLIPPETSKIMLALSLIFPLYYMALPLFYFEELES